MKKKKKSNNRIRKGGKVLRTLRSRVFQKFLFLSFIISILTIVGWIFYKEAAKKFTVKEIKVIGNRLLSNEEIIQLSMIKIGQSIFKVKGAIVRSRLMKSPWIEEVIIRKEPPNKVLINIKEAKPLALFEKKGKLFIIDKNGKILEEVKIKTPFLPIIKLKQYDNKLLQEVLKFVNVIKNEGFFSGKQIKIVASKAEDMTLIINNKKIIKIGKGRYKEKLIRLLQIEKEIKEKGIPVEYVDLRFSKRVIVSFQKE